MTPNQLRELLLSQQKSPKQNKYRNRKCSINGIAFASQKEGKRYTDLLLLQRAGEISNLKLQVRIKIYVKDEYLCTYIADFTYNDRRGNYIVEDAKGMRTPIYQLKKRLLFITQGIEIIET